MKQFCPKCEKWYDTPKLFCPKCGTQTISEEKYEQISNNISNNTSRQSPPPLTPEQSLANLSEPSNLDKTSDSLQKPDNTSSNAILDKLKLDTEITTFFIQGGVEKRKTLIPLDKEQTYLLMRLSKDVHFIATLYKVLIALSIIAAVTVGFIYILKLDS